MAAPGRAFTKGWRPGRRPGLPFSARRTGAGNVVCHTSGQGLPDFQQRLLGTLRRLVDHKGPGARWLLEHGEAPGLLLAYCVAGHHGGLPDFHNSGRDGAASLRQLCARAVPLPEVATPDADLVRVLQPPFGAHAVWPEFFYAAAVFRPGGCGLYGY